MANVKIHCLLLAQHMFETVVMSLFSLTLFITYCIMGCYAKQFLFMAFLKAMDIIWRIASYLQVKSNRLYWFTWYQQQRTTTGLNKKTILNIFPFKYLYLLYTKCMCFFLSVMYVTFYYTGVISFFTLPKPSSSFFSITMADCSNMFT